MRSGEIGVEVVEWRRSGANDVEADEDPADEDHPIELPEFRLRLDMEIRVEDEEGNLK